MTTPIFGKERAESRSERTRSRDKEAMGEVIDLEARRRAREAALKRRAQALRDAELRQAKQDDPQGPPKPGRDGGAGQV